MAFNGFKIAFCCLGIIPSLSVFAWGALRRGIKPELYALASATNAFVFVPLIVFYAPIRTGSVQIGAPGK